jgi:hypothetical protein
MCGERDDSGMRRASIALSLLAALAATTACTSHATKCVNGTCSITLSGEQTIGIDVGPVERDLRVGPIEPGSVTVAARGDQARLAAGETGQVGGITVQLVSVSGKDVQLVTRAG